MSNKLPSKVDQTEIPHGRRWDIKAVFDLETERIKAWVQHSANEIMSSPSSSFDSVRSAAIIANLEIRNTFGSLGDQIDRNLLNEAERGEVEQSTPHEWLLRAFAFLKWVAALAEILIFVWSAVVGLTNYFVITVGVMLALVGWILGLGISRLASRGRGDWSGWFATSFGAIGILLLSLARAGGELEGSLAVIVITVVVALVLAIFTALEAIGREQLVEAQRKMYICQRWKAANLHSAACDRGHWRTVFEQELQELDRTKKVEQANDLKHLDQTFAASSVSEVK